MTSAVESQESGADTMAETELVDAIRSGFAERSQWAKGELMDRVGFAPEGDRDRDLELGDSVIVHGVVNEDNYIIQADESVKRMRLRFWERVVEPFDSLKTGVICGARIFRSGEYVPPRSRGFAEYEPAYREFWRTHKVYKVAFHLWTEPLVALPEDLELRR